MIPKMVSNEGWSPIKDDHKSEVPLSGTRQFIALDGAGTTNLHK